MFGLAEAKALIVLHRKKGKAPDFSEARPYRHGVHPPVPFIFTWCHDNRRCQRMATATKRRRMVNAASSGSGAMRRRHEAAPDRCAVFKAHMK
jgi:hypothetical protein